jgi:ribosomal protein S18 acetylase RimI-like enzyme
MFGTERPQLLIDRLKNIGSAGLPVAMHGYYVRTLVVDEKCRRRGIGRTMTEQAFTGGLAAGCHSFRLDVEVDNEPAIKLYRSLGFESVHEATIPQLGIRMRSMLVKK